MVPSRPGPRDQPRIAGAQLMRTAGRFVLDTSILVAFVTAMNTNLTGIPIHEWLSVAVAAAIVWHLLTEWDWTVNAIGRFVGKLQALSRVNLLLDMLLFTAFVLVMVSGFLVSQSIFPLLGLSVPFGPTWRIIHALSADAALVLLGVHVGLHWRWVVKAARRLFPRGSALDAVG